MCKQQRLHMLMPPQKKCAETLHFDTLSKYQFVGIARTSLSVVRLFSILKSKACRMLQRCLHHDWRGWWQ